MTAKIRPAGPHTLPEFASVEEERTHLKQRMAAAYRLFDRFGFNEGIAGHLTARDPEFPDTFWVNPFGLSFGLIRASDMIRVNHEGVVVEGDWPVNIAAFAIHSQVHQARPDVMAAAHTHSKHGRAWSTLGRLLDPITQDSCSFFEDHGLFDNHGILTVGHSVDEAAWLYITMERTCEVQLLAEATGTKPISIDPEMARHTRNQVGSHFACWLSFQPLYDKIVADQPDLLE
jgi:ribulose-5-phosphate 4-epimerase/fuculose-1-phosphate aldolase